MERAKQMLNEFLELARIARADGNQSLARFYIRKADSLLTF